jgi:hypothetical protein
MSAPKKVDDRTLLEAWEATGSVRETARRLKIQYYSVYKRLVAGNHIRAATFNPDRLHTTRTIPEAPSLLIPDLQAPAHHPDALPFLCAVREKYQPVNIIGMGDEVDMNWLSDFARLPEADQPHSEWAAAQSFMRSFYAEFQNGTALTSNHVEGRLLKARTRGRIPPGFMRPIEDLIDAPIGWSWHSELRMGDIIFRHGHKDTAGLKRVVLEEIPAKYGRNYSLVIGHYHGKMGVATPDLKVGDKFYWGAFCGCLVDPAHPFMAYGKGYEKLGCAVISNGRFIPVAMPVNDAGRWTGKLP